MHSSHCGRRWELRAVLQKDEGCQVTAAGGQLSAGTADDDLHVTAGRISCLSFFLRRQYSLTTA